MEKTLTGGHDVWTGKLLDRLDNIKSKLIGDLPYTPITTNTGFRSGSSNLTIEKDEYNKSDKLKKTCA